MEGMKEEEGKGRMVRFFFFDWGKKVRKYK